MTQRKELIEEQMTQNIKLNYIDQVFVIYANTESLSHVLTLKDAKLAMELYAKEIMEELKMDKNIRTYMEKYDKKIIISTKKLGNIYDSGIYVHTVIKYECVPFCNFN